MNTKNIYHRRVALLLDILPIIYDFYCFAIKGGTAINLFVRDMPRLSIDIDLSYLPIEPRDIFLKQITQQLSLVTDKIEKQGYSVTKKYLHGTTQISKLLVSHQEVDIKIEPNLVLRGTVFGTEEKPLVKLAQDTFLQYQKARIVSLPDLYAEKICAALDRQHPRDLFDIKYLLENEGITNKIRQALVVYLASHARPMSELLNPNKQDILDVYHKEFVGMTQTNVSYEELEQTRHQLIKIIHQELTENERKFLLSIKQGEPNWELLPISHILTLPALQWKLINIRKMNGDLRNKALVKLRAVLKM